MRQQILAFLDAQQGAMRHLTEELVGIQSGTVNKAGVDRVVDHLSAFLAQRGFIPRRERQSLCGDILIVDAPAVADAAHPILLSGHMDTVFPEDSPFNAARLEGDRLHGPGTCDMKGGLVVAIFAALALREVGLHLPLRFLFSPDEEKSSVVMRERIFAEADQAAFGLVFEMAGPNNEVVRTRKGKVSLFADIHGQAGHAAFVTYDKVSAIRDAARKIELLEQLTTPREVTGPASLSVNVGRFCGGLGVNIVPEKASLDVEARCNTVAQTLEVEATMERILLTPQTPGSRTEITRRVTSPPLEARCTEALYALTTACAAELGQQVGEDFRPGCSEVSFMAMRGLPVLDGLGPLGAHDHSDREYLVLSSLRERAALSALLLVKGWDAWQAGRLPRLSMGALA